MSDTAVILAGGKGTRLYPYTVAIPKPLVPVGDKPILEHLIKKLSKEGFTNIIITVNHLAELIMAFFGDGKKWGVKISYSLEEIPLSTMGPLKLIQQLPSDFLIMNGDILTDLNFREFFDHHTTRGKIFSIASYYRQEKIDYGVLEINGDSTLSGFSEKPEMGFHVSMGIYAAMKDVLEYIPSNTYYGFDNLMNELLSKSREVYVHRYTGYWLDIGRPDDYQQAINDMNSK